MLITARLRKLLIFSLVITLTLACQAITQGVQPSSSPTTLPATVEVDTVLQLKIFQDLWDTVNEEYLYPDFNGVDWGAMGNEYRAHIEAGMTPDEFYLAMDEMIFRLGDEHSIYLSPTDAAAEEAEYAGNLDYVGIGIYSSLNQAGDGMVILLVFPDGPAEEAGIRAHDLILAADGIPIVDEDGFIRELIRGPEGTEVTLTIRTPGQEPREVTIPRRRISGSLPVDFQVIIAPSGKRVGYILIPTFTDRTIADQVGEAIETMSREAQLDGLILDNRVNGGGADTLLRGTLAYFIDGVAGYFVNREGEEPLFIRGSDVAGSQNMPLVVMVGPDTASFGEVFAGVLQDFGRAYVIGETTDGNVETLWGYDFEDGSRAWIAHDTFRPFNHPEQNWEEMGIIPDLEIPVRWEDVTFETDPAIQAAVEYLDTQ